MTDPLIAIKRKRADFLHDISNDVRFVCVSSESITSSPSARRWTPCASAASGRTRRWSASSSASTDTSSPTALWSGWCSPTRRTTRSPSSSSSPSSSRWPWWRWWSGAASAATSWPRVGGPLRFRSALVYVRRMFNVIVTDPGSAAVSEHLSGSPDRRGESCTVQLLFNVLIK